jgi:hypothetical protein
MICGSEDVLSEPLGMYNTERGIKDDKSEGPGPALFFILLAFSRSQRSGRVGSAQWVGRTVWVDEVERAVGLEPGLKLPCLLDQLRLGSFSKLVSTPRRGALLLVLIASLLAGLRAGLRVCVTAGVTADVTAVSTTAELELASSLTFSFFIRSPKPSS